MGFFCAPFERTLSKFNRLLLLSLTPPLDAKDTKTGNTNQINETRKVSKPLIKTKLEVLD